MTAQIPQEQPQTQPTTPPVEVPPVKPKKNIVLTGALILLFLIMAAALGYLGYQNYQLKKQISTLQSKESASSSGDNQQLTNNWKSYRGSRYSFKYPENWVLENEGAKSENISLKSSDNSVSLMLSQDIQGWGGTCTEVVDEGKIVVDGRQLSKTTTQPKSDPELCGLQVDKNEITIFLTLQTKDNSADILSYTYKKSNSEAESLFQNIISTFKFVISVLPTPSSKVDTSSWSEYSNDKVSFKTNHMGSVVEGNLKNYLQNTYKKSEEFIILANQQSILPQNLPLLNHACNTQTDAFCLIPGKNWGQKKDIQQYVIDNTNFDSYFITDNVHNSVVHIVYSKDANLLVATPVDGVLLEDEFLALLSTLNIK
jgi:hypothetical protein